MLDTGDEAAVQRFFAAEAPWDHVVVSAAQTPTGPVRRLGLADAKAAMESKFWGAYRVARAAKINDSGSLTFVSGFLSVRPSASSVLHGAINAALETLARGGDETLLKQAIAENFTDHTLPPGQPQGPDGPAFALRQFRAAVPDETSPIVRPFQKHPKSTVLAIEDEAIIVAFRRHTLLPLDNCLELCSRRHLDASVGYAMSRISGGVAGSKRSESLRC